FVTVNVTRLCARSIGHAGGAAPTTATVRSKTANDDIRRFMWSSRESQSEIALRLELDVQLHVLSPALVHDGQHVGESTFGNRSVAIGRGHERVLRELQAAVLPAERRGLDRQMHMRWRAVVGIWTGTDRLELESSRGVGSSPAAQPPWKSRPLAVEAGIICVVRKHDRACLWRDAIGSDHESGNRERRAGFRGGRDPAVLR